MKQGLATYLIAIARKKRVSAYTGNGLNRWPSKSVPTRKYLRLLRFKCTKFTMFTPSDFRSTRRRGFLCFCS